MKKAIIFAAILILLGAAIFAVRESNNAKIETRNIQIELDKNGKQLEELEGIKSETEKQFLESEEKRRLLEQEKIELEKQLQAKAELKAQRGAVAAAAEAPKVRQAPVVQVTGDKESWLRASGIPESEWWAVDSIVSRESSWNPNAVNKSSGACGLGQQLPCGKWAGAWNDPVAALKAQYGYVVARYGGYPQAVAFWNVNHWY